MGALKRTLFYDNHVKAGATLVDFGGWEMPIQYPSGIVDEHIHTPIKSGIFDVSHMGRFIVSGREATAFLQYVLTNNVLALDLLQAQYTMIPNSHGGAFDDAYLYRFYEDEYLLVVNAANAEKDWDHLNTEIKFFDAKIIDKSAEIAMISLQGPDSKTVLKKLTGSENLTEPLKNALGILDYQGATLLIARTGYTGEPLGFELFAKAAQATAIWEKLRELGAMPIGLGARDTLRLEAGLPLYGHELGLDHDGNEIPIFSCPLAKFAVSFAEVKGDYIGRAALAQQYIGFKKIMERAEDAYYLDHHRPLSIGRVKSFYGNFAVVVKAFAYIRSLGAVGLREASETAVLNANYIRARLQDDYELPFGKTCMHEVVFSGQKQMKFGVSALDIAKRLIDFGYHPPTIYFPLIVKEALMIEPTETESKETLDEFIEAMRQIAREAETSPELLKGAPHDTIVKRLDEVKAVRKPVLRYAKEV